MEKQTCLSDTSNCWNDLTGFFIPVPSLPSPSPFFQPIFSSIFRPLLTSLISLCEITITYSQQQVLYFLTLIQRQQTYLWTEAGASSRWKTPSLPTVCLRDCARSLYLGFFRGLFSSYSLLYKQKHIKITAELHIPRPPFFKILILTTNE